MPPKYNTSQQLQLCFLLLLTAASPSEVPEHPLLMHKRPKWQHKDEESVFTICSTAEDKQERKPIQLSSKERPSTFHSTSSKFMRITANPSLDPGIVVALSLWRDYYHGENHDWSEGQNTHTHTHAGVGVASAACLRRHP